MTERGNKADGTIKNSQKEYRARHSGAPGICFGVTVPFTAGTIIQRSAGLLSISAEEAEQIEEDIDEEDLCAVSIDEGCYVRMRDVNTIMEALTENEEED